MDEDLIDASDLTGFPGAPFPAPVVKAAAGAVRAEAGWHIAPEITETVEVDTGRSRVALLPSLRVVEVTEVRDADTGAVIEGWRARPNGVLRRRGGVWPAVIEVDLTHGYEACPDELLPVVAERAQRGRAGLVRQENIGARSVSYAQQYDATNVGTLARYTLPPRP